jgi:pimeloyl-ACP methyl ester carboxylesterase
VKAETSFIECGNGKIACYWRPGNGIPIVLLHGICGSAIHFNTVFTDYSLKNYSLLAIDLPGYGDSTPIPSWDISVVGEMVKSVMECFFDQKPWMITHSVSSSVAVLLLQYLSGVIFLEGNLLSKHLDFSDKILKSKKNEYIKEYKRIQCMAPMVLKYQTFIQDSNLLDYYANTYISCSADTVWNTADKCNQDVKNGEPIRRLKEWSGSMHCVYGKYSKYKDTISEIKNFLPDMRLHSVEESGHFPMIDNPVATWLIVANILKEK